MSHLHFPDGILPVWLWVGALAVAAITLALSLWYLSRKDVARKIPLVGVLSAVMIVGMSFEIVALAYHINLAIPTGIILGPAGALVAAFVTNLFLAMFGHGGLTVVGLNTLLLALEAILGLLFFRVIRLPSLFWRTAVATFVALALSGALAITLTVMAAPQEIGHHEEEGGNGFVRLELFTPQEGEEVAHEEETEHVEESTTDVRRFVTIALSLGVVGWVIESLLSGFIISYIGRVKPDLIRR